MKVIRYFFPLCASLLLLNVSLPAQTVPIRLDTMLNRTLDSMRIVVGAKSLSAAVQLSSGAVWKHADGISSVNPTVSVTPQDVYLIGSVTKTITSACILQLAQQGLLKIDDSLHKWLDPIPYVDSNITIRQLMQHTSGLFDVLAHPHNQDSLMADITRVWTAEELVDRFMAPPLFAPGTSWSYCNTNYFLLSMIIKKVTGNPFYTEIRNRFYAPLGLNTFAIPAFESMTSPVAHVWMDIDGDNILDDAHSFYSNYLALNSTAGAAGGYYATPSDCTKWMRSYMRGDVLSASMMAEAKTTVTASGSQGGLYGLGLMKNSFLGYEAWGHGGDLAYHASSWYFPAKDISITVFTNDNTKDSWKLLAVVKELLRTFVNTPTAIKNLEGMEEIAVRAYPNPVKDQLTVDVQLNSNEHEVDVLLQDVLGRTIAGHAKRQAGSKHFSAQFSGLDALSSGTYLVRINVDGKLSKTMKVIK